MVPHSVHGDYYLRNGSDNETTKYNKNWTAWPLLECKCCKAANNNKNTAAPCLPYLSTSLPAPLLRHIRTCPSDQLSEPLVAQPPRFGPSTILCISLIPIVFILGFASFNVAIFVTFLMYTCAHTIVYAYAWLGVYVCRCLHACVFVWICLKFALLAWKW